MTNQPGPSSTGIPHIVLVPLLAPGHMIPMLHMARLLAHGGATVTFVTTPLNAARIKPIIDQSTLPIHFLILPFPCAEAGLPEGTEHGDMLPSKDLAKNFFFASSLLLNPLILHLSSHIPPPSCIISDSGHPWTRNLALKFNIPRLVFHGEGCFALLCSRNIGMILGDGEDENEAFVVPNLPHRVEITRAQAPRFFDEPGLEKFKKERNEAEELADGVVVNSFDELEPSYRELYQKCTGKKVWTIGPMCLNIRDGNDADVDETRCLSWLDSMESGSVVYASFGSMARTAPAQLIEIGLGLEASHCPFIWVIKAGDKSREVDGWLLEGFEERIKGRGLIIRGWAPQVMIISHRAVGGFMTHCGWNSTLEAVSASVPMITWPHFADQFLNERLIVDVLRIGVSVGIKVPTNWGEEHVEAVVKRAEVEKAVRTLMDEGKLREEMRERAKALEKKAREAMGEAGSSNVNLSHLFKYISSWGDNVEENYI